MSKRTDNDELDRDMEDDTAYAQDSAAHAEHTRRLNSHDARFTKLEDRLDAACDELGDHLVGHSKNFPASPDPDEQKGLEVLAKARQVVTRLATPEGLAKRADEILTDPTEVGAVHGFLAAGDLASAAQIVAKAEGQAAQLSDQAQAKGDPLEAQMAEHKMLDRLSKLAEAVQGLSDRLTRLEARKIAPVPAPSRTVAKASAARRQTTNTPDPRETAQGLMTRAEGVVDSPNQIGNLSSLIQAGRLDEARAIIQRAELQHEADARKRERRSL